MKKSEVKRILKTKIHWLTSTIVLLTFIVGLADLTLFHSLYIDQVYSDTPVNNYSFVQNRQTAAVSDFDSSLIAHYTFDDTANDSKGGNHGTVNGDPSYVNGVVGGAMSFDGVDDFVSIGNNFDSPDAFSISVWIRPISLGNNKGIVSKLATGSGYLLGMQLGSGSYKPRMAINGTIVTPGGSSDALETGEWSHLVATYDGTNISLYKDGDLVAGPTPAEKPESTSANLLIGRANGGSTYVSAVIDDVRLYNKALTADEVEDLYDLGDTSVVPDIPNEPESEPDSSPEEDTTPPTVSNVQDKNVTATGATITWVTDEESTSQIEYGLNSNLGQSTAVDTSLVNSHNIPLTSLQPNTTYRYRAVSKDAAGNIGYSGQKTFTTAPASAPPSGSNITAASCNTSDVQNAINQVSEGGTVNVPAGTCIWTNDIAVMKGITIKGAGIGNTIIRENTGNYVFRLQTSAGKSYRITGFEFTDGSGRGDDIASGIINISGSSDSIRIDHNKFDKPRNVHIRTSGYVRGVADHNFHYPASGAATVYNLWHEEWAGGTKGDSSWSEPIHWGSKEAWYIENNYFEGPSGKAYGVTDTYGGTRFVFRYNTLLNTNLATHGTTDGAGRNRGLRQFEVYGNKITYNPPNSENTFHVRGGTGVYFNNSHFGVMKAVTLHYYRVGARSCGTFGTPTGLSAFDINDKSDGPLTPGGAGDGLFYEGIAGPGSGPNKLEVPGAGFQTNQWAKFQIYVPESSRNPNGYFASIVLNNDSDTITTHQNNFEDKCPHTFVPGERFEIRRVLLGIDQTGAGTSDLLTDKSTNPTPVNLHQIYDPVYAWNNSFDRRLNLGKPMTGTDNLVEGIHFHNDYCRPGYTPYIYPHPLIQQQDGVSTIPISLNCSGGVPPPVPELPQPPVTPTPSPLPLDTVVPVVSIVTPLNASTVKETIPITVVASDNVGVAGVEIRANGVLLVDDLVAPYTASLNTLSVPNGNTTIEAIARDVQGNISKVSVIIVVSNILVVDTLPPTAPTDLSGTVDPRSPRITLNWTKSTDNIAVAGYEIWRNGVKIDSTVSSTYTDRNIRSSTAYTYFVKAYDAQKNFSPQSSTINLNTPVYPETTPTPPVVPLPDNTPKVTIVPESPVYNQVTRFPSLLKFNKSSTATDIPIPGEVTPPEYVPFEPSEYLDSMIQSTKNFFVGVVERIIKGTKKIGEIVGI